MTKCQLKEPQFLHLACQAARPLVSNATAYGIEQEPPNFFVRGPHMLLHNSLRAGLLT